MISSTFLEEAALRVMSKSPYCIAGKILKSVGLVFEAYLPGARVGSRCRILPPHSDLQGDNFLEDPVANAIDQVKISKPRNHGQRGIEAEVIGFRDKRTILMPYEEAVGVSSECLVVIEEEEVHAEIGQNMFGRILDARVRPIDGKGALFEKKVGPAARLDLYRAPSDPLLRPLIHEPLDLGIRSINGLLTVGRGQRIGIFAGSGVGKSVLLGMMAKHTSADVNVIALIGERGREVREFIENELGEEGLAKSILIVATSDQSPLLRVRGAYLAAALSEYYRSMGLKVLLMMDSVTRFCMALREIGLSMGEPPTSKGYTPSVFSRLPKLLERAGTEAGGGSITGLYTVLVEGDDLEDPIADASRSILDGHIVLSRRLAQQNQFPAVDVLSSASRVMPAVVDPEHLEAASQWKEWLALYRQAEDLINIGAYVKGSNPKIDQAIQLNERMREFLKQGMKERGAFSAARDEVVAIWKMGLAQSQVARG